VRTASGPASFAPALLLLLGAGPATALTAGALPATAVPGRAHAATDPRVTLTLTAVTPTLTVGGSLVIDATVRAPVGGPDLGTVQGYLRYRHTPVTTTGGLPQDLRRPDDAGRTGGASPSDTIAGASLLTSRYADIADTLAPGRPARFRLTIPVADLHLAGAGVYPIDVVIRATLPDGSRAELAATRTVLPLVSAGSHLAVTALVPVTDRPHRLSRTVFADDQLALSLAPTGRLGRVLRAVTPPVAATAGADRSGGAGRSGGVSAQLIVDPMVLEEVAAMAGGYRVLDRTGDRHTGHSAAAPPEAGSDPIPRAPLGPLADADLPGVPTRAGTEAELARTWLGQLRAIAANKPVVLLPWGNPDPAGTDPALLQAAAGRARAVAADLGLAARLLRWPSTGAVPTPAASSADGAGADLVLLSSAQLTGAAASSGLHPLAGGVADAQAVVSEVTLDRAIGAAGGPLLRRQRFLTAAALLAMAPTRTPAVLVTLPSDWDPVRTPVPGLGAPVLEAGWLTPGPPLLIPAAPSAAPAPSTPVDQVSGEVSDPTVNLPRPTSYQIRQAAGLRHGADAFTAVLSVPAPVAEGFALAELQVLSRGWARQDGPAPVPPPTSGSPPRRPAGYDRFLDALAATLQGLRGAVSVPSTQSVTLSGSEGRFPITVSNRLAQRVRVGLRLQPANRLRLQVRSPNPAVVDVAAAGGTTVPVRAQARSNGETPVTVTVTNTQGTPLGAPTVFQVNARNYDTVTRVVIGAALALLFAATAVRIWRRVRRTRTGDGRRRATRLS